MYNAMWNVDGPSPRSQDVKLRSLRYLAGDGMSKKRGEMAVQQLEHVGRRAFDAYCNKRIVYLPIDISADRCELFRKGVSVAYKSASD